jgi:adenylate kinase family enzyme
MKTNMTPQTIVFFGRSGCGKGTQAKLLIEELEKKDSGNKVLYIETGGLIRNFISKDSSFAAVKVKKILEEGGLLPEFVPVTLWGDYLIKNLTGKEHMVFDGVGRREAEAIVFDATMRFYDRERPTIILMDVSKEWSMERLMARGRFDDDKEEIAKRLAWFDEHVRPAVSFFEKDSYYNFIKINGEQSVEAVHADIIKALGL